MERLACSFTRVQFGEDREEIESCIRKLHSLLAKALPEAFDGDDGAYFLPVALAGGKVPDAMDVAMQVTRRDTDDAAAVRKQLEVVVRVDDREVVVPLANIGLAPQEKAEEPPPQEQEQEETEEREIRLLPVEKKGEDKQIVFGIVLEPDEVDSQKDTIKADEIERAAHGWLARFQDRGLQHEKVVNSKVEIFESYIAPADLTIGKQKVKKGTWLLMLHVLDKALWRDIKAGKFTGFSMGGFARRVRT